MLALSYDECCRFLKIKYGELNKSYFTEASYFNHTFAKTAGITRGRVGLYVHHIDEDKAIMLSEPKAIMQWNQAYPKRKYQWAWQKAERLVYCNLLEHLVLHIKIVENPHPQKLPGHNVGIGGIFNFILPELNDIYGGITYKQPWKQAVMNTVKPMKQSYFQVLVYLLNSKPIIENPSFQYAQLFRSFPFNRSVGWSPNKNFHFYKEFFDYLTEQTSSQIAPGIDKFLDSFNKAKKQQ